MTPPLIRMPNGDAIRADVITMVRAEPVRSAPVQDWRAVLLPSVIVEVPSGFVNYDVPDNATATSERDRIIAEVNAATGRGVVAESTAVVSPLVSETAPKSTAWLPEPNEDGIFCYADGSGFHFDSRVGKWCGWWAPKGGRSSVPLRGYDDRCPERETKSYFLTAEEVAQSIADGGDGAAACHYDPLTHWLKPLA